LTEIRAFATESFSLDGSMLLYSEATMYQVQFDLAACLFVAAGWVYLEFALMESCGQLTTTKLAYVTSAASFDRSNRPRQASLPPFIVHRD
jgi:hypothetical protein